MKIFQAWMRARNPKTLETVASVLIFESDVRLPVESAIETIPDAANEIISKIKEANPNWLISTEMVINK